MNVLRSCNEGNLRLVVLNACNTRPQAEALTEVVDCVVSMNRTITDRAAIKFAASFYGALAFGRSVQKAFEQGVARLSAEGIAESDTPELLVRAGVDASRVTLVGRCRSEVAAAAAEAPFIVPFPRNGEFVGRDGDLKRLHASLSDPGSGPVGIRPAGLTGMGGIGKTQLVVEYVYRHRDDYPDGIFWIDAAGPLVDGFARLATDHRLRWAENEQPRDEQIRAAFKALNGRPHALLVLDNLPDPAAIAVHLLPDCVPEDLRCRMLFTTRRHDLGRFAGIEVTVLARGTGAAASAPTPVAPGGPGSFASRSRARPRDRPDAGPAAAGAGAGRGVSGQVQWRRVAGRLSRGVEVRRGPGDARCRCRRVDRGRPEASARPGRGGHDQRAVGVVTGRVGPAAASGREPVLGIGRGADRAARPSGGPRRHREAGTAFAAAPRRAAPG